MSILANPAEPMAFGTLEDAAVRQAWPHEAHRFTPWLADNLDRLSAVIGIPLELSGQEIGVGAFSADILARNPADDCVVLIENQLEGSDHTHLGQIMTYLAGLEAHTMIWVAPSFREEHLSAIRWLNQHTVDPFAFFAIRVRVVRIGNSPLAPLFEVVERPNNWDRSVAGKRREAESDRTALGQFRLDFWTNYCERYPGAGRPDAASSRWVDLPDTSLKLVLYVAKDRVGVFVRPGRGCSRDEMREELNRRAETLQQRLGLSVDELINGSTSLVGDTQDRSQWLAMADWLEQQKQRYLVAFND